MKLDIRNCREARQILNFLSNSSLEFDRGELERHLRLCPACAEKFSERERMKKLLKRAFKASPATPERLRLSIQNLIGSEA